MKIRLDAAACDMLVRAMRRFSEWRLIEAHEHGIDPVMYPDEYMTVELLEPVHHRVRAKALRNRSIVTLPLLMEWMEQEQYEEGDPIQVEALVVPHYSNQQDPRYIKHEC